MCECVCGCVLPLKQTHLGPAQTQTLTGPDNHFKKKRWAGEQRNESKEMFAGGLCRFPQSRTAEPVWTLFDVCVRKSLWIEPEPQEQEWKKKKKKKIESTTEIERGREKERETDRCRVMFKSEYLLLTCAEQREVYTAEGFKELSSEKEWDNRGKAARGPDSKSATLCCRLWSPQTCPHVYAFQSSHTLNTLRLEAQAEYLPKD